MTSGEGVDDLERETCLRCGGRMSLLYRKFLQTGTPGWHLRGGLECVDSSLLPVEVWCCRECRRLEFYLAEDAAGVYVLKQIHHEPCDYYQFGDKLASEKKDYMRLLAAGIRMPKLLDTDEEKERILKEYIKGPTVYELVLREQMRPCFSSLIMYPKTWGIPKTATVKIKKEWLKAGENSISN